MPKGKNEMVEKLLKASSSSPRKHGKNVMCYRCGEKGHLAEICRKEATRFVCGAFGHRSFYCPRRGKQGNQVILFLVLQPYEDMVRNVEHLRKCAVSLRGRAFLSIKLAPIPNLDCNTHHDTVGKRASQRLIAYVIPDRPDLLKDQNKEIFNKSLRFQKVNHIGSGRRSRKETGPRLFYS